MKIDRKAFFDSVRLTLFGGSLTQKQVEGMSAILDYWEREHTTADGRWLAYLLGTAYHETDRKMQPVREYGSTAYFNRRYSAPPTGRSAAVAKSLGNTEQDDGARFCGRGFVQLTGRRNYADWARRLELDLVGDPDLALDLDASVRILVEGSILGTFTGKKLSDYFEGPTGDWRNARRIINRLDKADLIGGEARNFYAAIAPSH
jgi:putative chitinase